MKDHPPSERPIVSVILAVRNEAHWIGKCLASLQSQEAPDFDLEILAIDGRSTDGTREVLDRLARTDPRVKVLDNPQMRTPFAFNLGLRAARGDLVCIFGSHTIYRPDYIRVCREQLRAHGAVGCQGRILTCSEGRRLENRLVIWALSHRFGSSGKSFRTQGDGFVDALNFPVLIRQAVIEAGGYDEELVRNQDNDMNQKLRARGHKLYSTGKTCCRYYPKDTIREMLRYATRNGFWNVVSLKKNPSSMGVRHFVPFLFLLGLLVSVLLAATGFLAPVPDRILWILPLLALLGAHLGAGLVASLQVAARESSAGALWLPLVFLAFHAAYGWGTLAGLASVGRGSGPRPESLPAVKGKSFRRSKSWS